MPRIAIESLPPRDREIIDLYRAGVTLAVIADRFGMTYANVQRLVLANTGSLDRDD
jgi:hypothetical protein